MSSPTDTPLIALPPPCRNWERLVESSEKKCTNGEKRKLIEACDSTPTCVLSHSKIYDTQYLL